MNVLVIGAHPDDETIGVGGTIIKHLQNGDKVHIILFSVGHKPIQPKLKEQAYEALKVFGINKNNLNWLNCKSGQFELDSKLKVNSKLAKLVSKIKPKIVYTTPSNDISKDHLTIHECTLVATRPHTNNVKQVLSYEVPGPVKTTFTPNVYENISKEFPYKINAFKKYKSEIEKFPHYRSIEALEMLSKKRGIEAGFSKAEAFQLISWYRDD